MHAPFSNMFATQCTYTQLQQKLERFMQPMGSCYLGYGQGDIRMIVVYSVSTYPGNDCPWFESDCRIV